ncbi:TraB/GumN family protein [Massilia sp. LC238]|uniref:TraB/GumN family protein n=1 Tax=Massilia sp. LC238 TaxID=1502852 RepID=UPI0004E41BEF|nr:TraB/GumN family protein [Massilia sp. LC238]KFC67988.1 TraB family protein [Massilia sp. LC238]
MLKFAILPALCLALCAAPSFAQTADLAAAPAATTAASSDEAPAAPEQILVVGQKPGPGMWKVSKDEHVLWIFGTYSPLPVKMDWRSHEVEAVIGRSQEYLAPPVTKVEASYFKMALALPSLIGVNKNPDDAQLRDVLPAEVYARWLPLKEKYLPKNKERDRPIFVANELFSAALKQASLTNSTDVRKQVEKIVDQKKLKVTRTVNEVKIDNPRQLIKDFKKSQIDDVACFSNTLKRLETDIDAMRVRANAWAKGDIDAIRKLDFNEQESCSNAIRNSAVLRDHPAFQGAEERHRAMWLANAEAALAKNSSTFAVLAMKDLLDPKGLMAALAAKGYTVEQPE